VYFFVINDASTTCFDLIRSSSGRDTCYVNSCTVLLFLVHCSKTWLKLIPIIVEF
jgi:hypothetical protein